MTLVQNEAAIIDATVDDRLALSAYLKTPVTVADVQTTTDGRVLVIESRAGGTQYRLRSIDDDDDRLLFEKPDGDGWKPHIRLNAATITDD
jgi:regulatory protein YycI of two-component signal transduction system YycFG